MTSDYKENVTKAKAELKALVAEIKEHKAKYYERGSASREFRYKHLAYCLMRGRSLRQVEQTNREGNEPSREAILRDIGNMFGKDAESYASPFVLTTDADFKIPRPITPEVPNEQDVHSYAS